MFLLHFLEFGNPKWLSQAPGLTGFYFNILCDKILFIMIDEHPGISYSMRKRDWHDAFMSFPNLTTTLFTTGFIVLMAGRFLRILLMSRSEFFLLTLKFIFCYYHQQITFSTTNHWVATVHQTLCKQDPKFFGDDS